MRKTHGFHGGIHPPENKHQSVTTPIADAGIPPQLTVPLSQHIGAPAQPVVSIGDHVLKGQVIAEPRGLVSVPKHAPSSGTVLAIEDRLVPHPSGHLAPCIVIETDGRDEWIEHSGTSAGGTPDGGTPDGGTPDFTDMSKAELVERIRNAGIAGMGGAGFPSAVKLTLQPHVTIDTLIINGTECEPYITADDMLMRERPGQIIGGAKILRQLIEPRETLIGVEDNKPEGIAALCAAAEGTGIEVVSFPTKYPSGGEKQLIEILTGKQVPSGGLPSAIGVVCQNLGSAAAVYEAIVDGRPLISRVTTVTGESVRHPQNFQVLIGTPMRYLLQRAGYEPERNNRLIMGGPMMGFTVPDPDVPVVKTTNCLLAPTEEELPTPPPAQACIRCGMCAEACPASLLPQQMFWFAQGREYEKLEQHNLFDCIECGACSYVCPSNIPLVQYYRASKAEIQQQRRDHQKAEYSRERFEARQRRLEREEREKEEKRAARKKAAQARARDTDGAEDPVQAAIERARAKKAARQSDGQARLNPDEQARADLQKLEQRLQASRQKLEQSRRVGEADKVIEALEATVERLSAKVEDARRQLGTEERA